MKNPLASRIGLLAAAAIALPTLAACLDHPLKPVQYDKEQQKDEGIALEVNKDVDILFIIDNSGSMGEEQATLAQNFPSFVAVLEADGIEANYRLGVPTTDNGNQFCAAGPGAGKIRVRSCLTAPSEFVYAPGSPIEVNRFAEACEDVCVHPTITTTNGEPWLESVEGNTNIVEGVPMGEAFQCVGPQGISGCGFESHLESMYKALKRTEVQNESQFGFLRSNAILSIVFVTDEADCSFQTEFADIFALDGNRVFWSDPMADQPTSAVCWNAGVSCTGNGAPYDDCTSTDFDINGAVTTNPTQAVLHTLSRYINQLQTFEDQKRLINPSQEVLVAVIAGVPVGYETYQAPIGYQDGADPQFFSDFGIGVGCSSAAGEAVPPVRLREFAEAFNTDAGNSLNLFSICADDYSPALQKIADTIADQLRPACFPRCVADIDVATAGVQPLCVLTETQPQEDGFVELDVPACLADGTVPGGTNTCYVTKTGAALDEACSNEGYNLEFELVRREGFPAPGGTAVSATCKLSEQKAIDCPNF